MPKRIKEHPPKVDGVVQGFKAAEVEIEEAVKLESAASMDEAVGEEDGVEATGEGAEAVGGEFTAEDFNFLAQNEHQRYAPNSKKIAHALITSSAGKKVALQFPIPEAESAEITVRPLIDIQEIEPFPGMRRYRAVTPVGKTPMFAKRFIEGVVGDPDGQEQIEVACFSPSNDKNPEKPFWGSIKSTPLFRKNFTKAEQRDLDKDLAEIKETVKGGPELIVDKASVPQRDQMPTRKPDQNTVMGESARDAYEHLFEKLTDELHPEMKARLHRSFSANIRGPFYVNAHRPEWLHLYGWSLTPMNQNPQHQGNLGAAPKWANTQMMVLERIIKWFALNSPESLLSIQAKFDMLLDSELAKHIDFKVKIQIKERYVQLMQKIDPFLAYPVFPKASDLAQGAAITYDLLHGIPPVSEQEVIGARRVAPAIVPSSAAAAVSAPASQALSKKENPQKTSLGGTSQQEETSLNKEHRGMKVQKVKGDATTQIGASDYEQSTVQVYTRSSIPDYDNPWSAPAEQQCSGSGFVTEHEGELYILTNAHVVADGKYIRVRLANDRTRKYEAECVCVAYQADLALLKVRDPEFKSKAVPAQLGSMVGPRQKVMTVGFPMAGEEISVSKGIVSRIEVRDYEMSGQHMLQVQVDAAINHGNSGGPVYSEGRVVGLAFQGYDLQGLGFMIPMPIVHHFLQEVFSGKKFRGFPVIPFNFEELENAHERKYYQLGDRTGVRITNLALLSDAHHQLKEDDILLSIDGMKISNEGTIDVPGIGPCIHLVHAMHMKYIGDSIRFQVLRRNAVSLESEVIDVDVILDCVPGDTEKVGMPEHDKMPTYFINSGLCFQPITRNYMEGEGSVFEEFRLIDEGSLLADASKKSPDEQIIVVSHILDCEATQGYSKKVNEIVKDINGISINNIHDVVHAIESNHASTHVITFVSKSKIIVPNMSKKEHEDLLSRYDIPSARSKDLLPKVPAAVSVASVAATAAPSSSAGKAKPAEASYSAPGSRKKVRLAKAVISSDEEDEDDDLVAHPHGAGLPALKRGVAAEEGDNPLGQVGIGHRRYMAGLDAMEARFAASGEEEAPFDFDALDEKDDDDESEESCDAAEADESDDADEAEAKPLMAAQSARSGVKPSGTLGRFFAGSQAAASRPKPEESLTGKRARG